MNPLGDDVLKSPYQLCLEKHYIGIFRISLVLFILATINIGVSIKSGEAISFFWYCVAVLTIITIIGLITGNSEKLNHYCPYKVAKGNTDVYFLNDANQVELAKPGQYCGARKSRLFKIELSATRQARFTIPCGYLCYVSYQVEFCCQPSAEEVEVFLAWLNELNKLRKMEQKAVMEKLQKDAKEGNYPFKILTKFERLGIAF